jgi:hypothetical protein
MCAVNGAGPNIDVGAFTFNLLAGDKVVYYQSPVFTPDSLLAVRRPQRHSCPARRRRSPSSATH